MADYLRAVWAFWKMFAAIVIIFGGLAALNELKSGRLKLSLPNKSFLRGWYEQHGVRAGYIPPNAPERSTGLLARPDAGVSEDRSDPFWDLRYTNRPRPASPQ